MAARLRSLILLTFAAGLAACHAVPSGDPATVFLVRHAEKDTGTPPTNGINPSDPPLTDAGQQRAELLADVLSGEGLKAVWSTDYVRTRDTAAPVAARFGLDVQTYDPGNLKRFADTLRAADQTVLVVGHSNTTPQLVTALGGEAGSPIDEKAEYDRLYVVDLETGNTELRRYGLAFTPVGDDE